VNGFDTLPRSPRLADVVDRLIRIGLNVAGLAALGSSLLLLVISPAERHLLDWLVMAICTAIWLGGYLTHSLKQRAVVSATSLGLLLVAPVLVSGLERPFGAPAFVNTINVAFAAIFSAVIALDVFAASIGLLSITISVALVVQIAPPIAALSPNSIVNWLGVTYCLIVGLGLILTRSQWHGYAHSADRKYEALRELEVEERRAREVNTARAAVDRRVHETILNTLAGISFGVAEEHRNTAIAACRHDLAQLDRGMPQRDSLEAQAVIAEAVTAASRGALECHVMLHASPSLLPETATGLRDVIVECLRNVSRHSGSNLAWIECSSTDQEVLVTVTDRGNGINPAKPDRFGVPYAVHEAMLGIGGSATFTSDPTVGTTVSLRAPLVQPKDVPSPPDVATVLDVSRLGRIGLLGGNLVLVISAIPLTRPLGIAWLSMALALILLLVNLTLALTWTSRWRIPLAVISISISAGILLAAALTSPECLVAPQVGSLAGFVCGSVSALAFFAPRRPAGRAVMISVPFIAGTILVTELPRSCQSGTLVSVLVATAYFVALWYLLRWSETQFVKERNEAAETSMRILESRLTAERAAAEISRWDYLSVGARDLLTAIVTGALDPCSEEARVLADGEANLIRHQLGRVPTASTADGLRVALE
jgi:hypothetical protein